jgi:DNA-binding FadR family transcriptional regulator
VSEKLGEDPAGDKTASTSTAATPALSLRPARRERLSDVLYGQILEQMAEGMLKKGDKLPPEQEICAAFGVSRPVVREALMRLRADGLVSSRQGAGTFVSKAPPANMMKFARAADVASYLRSFEVRIGLETEAARLAAQHRSEKQLRKIVEALEALRAAFADGRNGGPEDYIFHLSIAEATGNRLFGELMNTLRGLVQGQMSLAHGLTRRGSEERRNQVIAEHQRIVEAIEAQDSDAAALFMRHHLVQARARSTDATRKI